eukprot:1966020-Amphidinium_carterae.1
MSQLDIGFKQTRREAMVQQNISLNALHDGPSRAAYGKYIELVHEWNISIVIPPGTPRPLGAPAKTTEWREDEAHEGFKSETLNMLPWIIEEVVKEATPHPGNLLTTMSADTVDNGEEHGYEIVKFWSEGKRMITSLSCFKQADDPVNGPQIQVLMAKDTETTADDSASQIRQIDETKLPPRAASKSAGVRA